MSPSDRFCKACARPLKEKRIVKPREGVVSVWVCRSPICRLYNQAVK
jgi:hypothetical protein